VATAGNSILPGGWRHPGIPAHWHPGILASRSSRGDTGDAFVDLWPTLAFITGEEGSAHMSPRKKATATKYP